MSLSWFLALGLVSGLLCLSLAAYSIYSIRGHVPRLYLSALSAYAVVLLLIMAWMVAHFIGWNTQGSPQINRQQQRRIGHTGYYFGREGHLRLLRPAGPSLPETHGNVASSVQDQTAEQREAIRELISDDVLTAYGRSSDQNTKRAPEISLDTDPLGFTNSDLQPGEHLTLKPLWNGDQAQQWNLTYKITNLPLRINSVDQGESLGRCVNVPDQQWLNPGDTLFLTRQSNGQTLFVEIKWTVGSKYWRPFRRTTNSYHFGEGTVGPDGSLVYNKGPALLMSETVLSDGAPIATLVRRANKAFRESVRSIDQQWWSVFNELTLVRELRGDRNSRLGFLVSDDFFRQAGLTLYLNYAGPASRPIGAPEDTPQSLTVPTDATVSYGFRGRDSSFELQLAKEVTVDEIWGQVVHVSFTQPELWSLPPEPTKDFIITSATDYIPLDGYLLETGNPRHSFYAKATVNSTFDELSINDGKHVIKNGSGGAEKTGPRLFRLGTSAALGDYEQGILIALLPSQSPTRSAAWARWLAPQDTGRAALILLGLNVFAFVLFTLKERHNRPALYLGWAVIWGIGLTLLCVRLVLIYRLSALPPLDASQGEVRNVFDKGVDLSLLGLLLFLLITVGLFLVRRRSRQVNFSTMALTALLSLWALVVVGYIGFGSILGSSQAFLGVRISILVQLLLLGGIALLSRHLLERAKLFTIALIVVALALEVFVVEDAGSIIYAWSFLFAIVVMWGWRRPRHATADWFKYKLGRFPTLRKIQQTVTRPFSGPRVSALMTGFAEWCIPTLLPIAGLLTFLFIPYLIQVGWLRGIVEPAVPDTTFYRFASFTDSEDVILTTRSGEEATDMSKLLDNSLQHWQMLLYASHGVADPVGYGQAPLSKVGMTYPTSVSDCAFATFILAEHGRTAGVFILILYVLLAVASVISGWFLDDNVRHRNVVLIAIGGFFACNSLYMASANVGLVTFTGQNLPLLGLASGGDLVQGLLLLGIAGCMLLSTNQESEPKVLWRRSPITFRWGIGLCSVALIWLVVTNFQIGRLRKETLRDNHDLKPETVEQIAKNLPAGSSSSGAKQNAPLVLNGDKLDRAEGGRIMAVEEQYRKQFNERTDKFNAQGGLYYLERRTGASSAPEFRVKLNKSFFFARSPFKQLTQWRGRIVAGGNNDPTLYGVGSRFRVSLRTGGLPASIDLNKPSPVLTNSSVLLKEGNYQFFQLERSGTQLELHPKQGSWSIFVDGTLVTSKRVLEPLNIIVIERERQRSNLIYLGPTGPVLAYVRWRNGGHRRMFPEGDLALAYFLGKAGDRTISMEAEIGPITSERLSSELAVTLELGLHKELQQLMNSYAIRSANYQPFQAYPNRLSATVIDAFDGRVLALPSWPLVDPNKRLYEKLIDKIPEPTRSRLENNGNLITDHVVGSTIKPVVFTALARQLWPERNLAGLKVFNRSSAGPTVVAGETLTHPHVRVGGINIEVWDCNSSHTEADMKQFLIDSLDYPEGLLLMLGLVKNTSDLPRVLTRNESSPDLIMDGSPYQLNLALVPESGSVFTLQDQRDGRLPMPLAQQFINETIVFRGLNEVFDFDTASVREDRLRHACELFVPLFAAHPTISLNRNGFLDNVVPNRLQMNNADFQGVRQGLVSCFLGGAPCTFNNVMMAEAAARLATGQRIFAQLQHRTQTVSDLPAPLNDAAWRNENIIEPLERVGQEGTARSLTTRGTLVRIPPGYRAIYKTGTIVEGDEGRESEALMFVIGRWENQSFVRNETIAGFVYMEKSKEKRPDKHDGNMKKFEFSAPLLNAVVRYLEAKRPE